MARSLMRTLVALGTIAGGALFASALRPLTEPAAALPEPVLDEAPAELAGPGREEVAVFAGGCFWGVQEVFEHVKGVKSAISGYAGGHADSPSYGEVSSGATGHAESVRVVYDPAQVTYGQLLQVFFSVAHDPTQVNRQGPDVGTQYRSIVFYADEGQRQIARAYMDRLTRSHAFARPIATQLVPLGAFYRAEEYHQDYAERHPYQPYIMINDAPKVERLKRSLPALYRDYRSSLATSNGR